MSNRRNRRNVCDMHNVIKPSTSSLIGAQSWSLGVGAKLKDYENAATADEDEDNDDDDEDNNEDDESVRHEQSSEQPNRQQRHSNSSNNKKMSIKSTSESAAAAANQHSLSTKQLLNLKLQIPFVYLVKKDISSASHHVYQVTITCSTGNDGCSVVNRWSVYRRYSQFHELHQQLKAKDSAVSKFTFPPKRTLNSKTSTIVQERRRKLEIYLRQVAAHLEQLPVHCGEEEEEDIRSVISSASSSLAQPVDSNSTGATGIEQQQQPVGADSTSQVVVSPQGKAKSLSVRSLFHNFISLSEMKDEAFDVEEQ